MFGVKSEKYADCNEMNGPEELIMNKYWSPLLGTLKPYTAGEQPRDKKYIKLNTNENPYGPSPHVHEVLRSFDTELLKLYPDPDSSELKRDISEFYNLKKSQVFVANGSDELLALLWMAFFQKETPLEFPEITYSFYPVYCNIFNTPHRKVPMTEGLEVDLNSFSVGSGGIIFPNPNAPTGHCFSLDVIEAFLKKHESTPVVIDEAYIDFGGETAVPLTEKYPNLLVVKTLSKSRSLAGMRVGYAVGSKELITALNMVKDSFNSYPLDRVAQASAAAAIRDREYFDITRKKVIETRENTVKELKALGFDLIPSMANFVLAKPPVISAETLYLELKKRGVLVRYFKNAETVKEYCRITIGSDEEMEVFLKKTKEILSSQ